jgi:hypothetical protein
MPKSLKRLIHLSKILERSLNPDHKHYTFTSSRQKETGKLGINLNMQKQHLLRRKTEKEGICGRFRHATVGSTPTPGLDG